MQMEEGHGQMWTVEQSAVPREEVSPEPSPGGPPESTQGICSCVTLHAGGQGCVRASHGGAQADRVLPGLSSLEQFLCSHF